MYGPNLGYNNLWVSSPPHIKLVDDPDHPRLKAFAAVVLNDALAIKNIRVVKVGDRLIVAFPSRQNDQGEHYDVAHPLDNKTRRMIETHILHAYCDARQEAMNAYVEAHPAIFDFLAKHLAEAC